MMIFLWSGFLHEGWKRYPFLCIDRKTQDDSEKKDLAYSPTPCVAWGHAQILLINLM